MDNAVPPPPPPMPGPVPVAPPKKPVYRQWWFVVGAVVLLLCVCGSGVAALNSGGDDDKPSNSANSPPGEEPKDEAPADDAAAEPATDPYDDEYGTFEKVEKSGSGDTVIELPAGARAGIVTASHDGSANFIVSGLDKDNEQTGDLLVNTIGDYKGTTAFGLSGLGEPAVFEVKADGAWKITIAPLSTAKALPSPAKGGGDAVYRYDGDAATWEAEHAGQANFIVAQYPVSGFPNLAINEIGKYEGTVAAKAGPSIVTIMADGKWTLAA